MHISESRSYPCDIAIVGGGLAGLTAGLVIASQGDASVILIDRDIGSNQSMPLTFLDTVQQFGLEESIVARYHSFALRTRSGGQVLRRFDGTPLVVLDYRSACRQLYEHLRTYSTFAHLPLQARHLAREAVGWRVGLQDGGEVVSRLLIDASGIAHFSARQLGYALPPMYSHSYGQVFGDCNVPADQEGVALFLTGNPRHGNGGGWFYPLSARQASFGFAQLTNLSRFPAQECRQGFERAVQEFHPYAEIMQASKREGAHLGSIPLGPVKRLACDGLMRVGDAAGQATPWACMGVEPALLNGQLCGQVAVRAFRRGDLSRSGLQDYEKMWFARNGAGYRKAVMLADLEWQRGEAAWDNTLNQLDRLSGPEMLNSLRYNTPAFSLPLIWGLLVYDRLGLIRRGLRNRLWVRWGSAQLRRDDGR